jgi:hypothetical protein
MYIFLIVCICRMKPVVYSSRERYVWITFACGTCFMASTPLCDYISYTPGILTINDRYAGLDPVCWYCSHMFTLLYMLCWSRDQVNHSYDCEQLWTSYPYRCGSPWTIAFYMQQRHSSGNMFNTDTITNSWRLFFSHYKQKDLQSLTQNVNEMFPVYVSVNRYCDVNTADVLHRASTVIRTELSSFGSGCHHQGVIWVSSSVQCRHFWPGCHHQYKVAISLIQLLKAFNMICCLWIIT